MAKTLLITLDFPPVVGGVANYYANLVKYWPDQNIAVLNNNQGKLASNSLPFLKWLPALIVLGTLVMFYFKHYRLKIFGSA